MPGSQTVYMYFLSPGLWRVRVYHPQALQQIQIVYYNDRKLRLLITESEHWLSLLAQILTNRLSEELPSDGRWPLTQPFSGAEWTAHSFRKPSPKFSGGTPMQRPVLAKGDGQEPSRSQNAVKLLSHCLPAWGHTNCLCSATFESPLSFFPLRGRNLRRF